MALHGWIILDKSLGLSSAGAVGAVKRVLREGGYGKTKIGHGGTLDPLATGVLPIALGEATKLAGRMLDATKGYQFTVSFGAATTTDDAEGEVVATSDIRPTRPEIEAALPQFTGPITQMPPAYSALKVDGKRAYALARAGVTVTLVSRQLIIHSLTLLEVTDQTATLEVVCSKGTYVRSLARDLAQTLGTVGHVSMLRRIRAGPFGIDAAITLDKLALLGQERALEQALLPLIAGLDDIPVLAVEPAEADFLRKGGQLGGRSESHGLYLATTGSVPVALVEISHGDMRVVRGFNL